MLQELLFDLVNIEIKNEPMIYYNKLKVLIVM